MKHLLFILILFCSLQGFGQKVVGYWRMNGNSNDASGNSYNMSNTNVTFLSGGQNGVASLSGTGYMRSGNNLGLTSWSSPISVELICKINVEPTSSGYVLFCWQPGGTSSNGRFVIGYNYVNTTTNAFVASRYHENPADYDECAFNMKAGTQKYYHIVGTYNGTTLKLYVNGNYITSFPSDASGGTSTIYSAANTSIGSYIYNDLYKSNVSIDKCIVYNGELSVASIKNKYSDFIGIY